MSSNVACFIDIGNLYYCIGKKYENKKTNYEKLLTKVAEFGTIRRATAYGTQIEEEAKSFIACLRKLGYDTKYKRTKVIESEEKKIYRYTSWNVGIAIDIVKMIGRVDIIIIGSADSELIPLIQWVKDQGVKVIILACGISREMKDSCDSFIEISEEFLE